MADKKKYKNILFDLDGTISDSSVGIMKAFEYSFAKMNKQCPSSKELLSFIGPPLAGTYAKYFSKSQIKEVRAFYREYYLNKGMHENQMYSDIPCVLEQIENKKIKMFVATCKATYNARVIIKNFGIDNYFEGVYGVEEPNNILDKTDVIKNVMDTYNLNSNETLFIGDTLHDTIGAYENKIDMCFVNYGFGRADELQDYPVAFFVNTPKEILSCIS